MTEAGGVGETAQIAVGWTVRNRMARNGATHVDQAWRGYQHRKAPTAAALVIAAGILHGKIPDPTDGATHFYTPEIMPKIGEDTTGIDVAGGLESVPGVQNHTGNPVQNYRPGFAAHFMPRPVTGIPEAKFKFYRQPGTGHVH